MTTKQKWATGLTIVAIIAIIYFWDDISAQWAKWFPGETATPKDGDACTGANGQAGTYRSGVCVGADGSNLKTIGQQRCPQGQTWKFDSLNNRWGCFPN